MPYEKAYRITALRFLVGEKSIHHSVYSYATVRVIQILRLR
jgi:hypothetical protein